MSSPKVNMDRMTLNLTLKDIYKCEAAGMRIGTSKSEAVVLSRKLVDCPLRAETESLPHEGV